MTITITSSVAGAILGLRRSSDVRRLVAAGILHDVRAQGNRNVKIDLAEAQAVAAWGHVDPEEEEKIALILHVAGGAFRRPGGGLGGYHATTSPGTAGWARFWSISQEVSEASVGAIAVADVAGFVGPGAAARITGFRRTTQGTEFDLVVDEETRTLERRRITPRPGGPWQLGGAFDLESARR